MTTCAPRRRSRFWRSCRRRFKKDGTVTAGNASGIVDGGAALIWLRAMPPIGIS